MAILSILRLGVVSALLWSLSGEVALAHPWHELESPDVFLGSVEITTQLFLAGIAIAFSFGALHALAPGHGKTMVAAYLVGNQGTAKHALLLGLITTITHTISVLALAVLALVASQYILPEQLYPVLSTLSGLTVLGVGLWLFRQSWSMAGAPLFPQHSSDVPVLLTDQATDQATTIDSPHVDLQHTHHQSASHDHPHASYPSLHTPHLWEAIKGKPLESQDPQNLRHPNIAHCDCGHTHAIPNDFSLKSLIALGIAGGMVPCPSALVLLLSAIAFHHVTYGLFLVSGFSLGMASVLITLGLMVVYAKRWLENLPSQSSWFRYLPMASASVIILTGIVLTGYAVLPNPIS